ncbi:hypothetical protein MUTS16_52550 [Escherichia coli]|nr:hypothetical protein MUTS16_52550 [Escherichia coli]
MIFSPDGHCRPFDASAEGTWAGNGLGCVVLRRLRDALLSGDPIISVILSSAVNNDGNRKVGYTAPSVAGQQAVIEEALMLAAIDDRQVGYIETHGTGTPLGDAIEIEALRNVYAPRPQDQRCALGSVKSNMGHLDTAAGIAGLLKTVLAVSRGQIPPLLNFHTPNPALKLEESPFTIPVSAQAWQDEMRYAGVSSFGIGGTNCHMIVASLPDALNARLPNTDSGRKSTALLLSAASDSALRRLATDYAGALRENADASSLAFTALHARRLDLPFRLAAPLNRETAEALSAWAGEKSGRWFTAATAPAASRCGCLPARARTGALWVKRCTSTQRRLPTRWIAVFPPVAKCSRRHCAKRCLTPIRRSWTIWPGRSRRLSRLKSRWRRTGVLKD